MTRIIRFCPDPLAGTCFNHGGEPPHRQPFHTPLPLPPALRPSFEAQEFISTSSSQPAAGEADVKGILGSSSSFHLPAPLTCFSTEVISIVCCC
ncbi:hypothetical protein SKAU_G00256460 [Synaphobranchus kaupii]|uniref:Uncharacterized protein n=1 Tax=Synaphobranchus kaupii TaxID=118154 RepID=A0A9Q1F423_SYNKA|nr:hypothetical protein SKAU_G00256460 [Synaphobranchus kaupii]